MRLATVGRWFAEEIRVAAIAPGGIGKSATAATYVYVSNADDGDISTYRLDDSGELRPGARVRVAKGVMPMAVSPDRRFLYAVSRSLPCAIHVLAIDPRTGALTPVSTSPLAESLPYISLDKTGRFLLGCVVCGERRHRHGRRRRRACGSPSLCR